MLLGFHINVGTEFVPNTRLDPLIASEARLHRWNTPELRLNKTSTAVLLHFGTAVQTGELYTAVYACIHYYSCI
jgi:hypothetical protein